MELPVLSENQFGNTGYDLRRFRLLLTGFFGVASAASTDQPVLTPDTTSNVAGNDLSM